MSVPPQAHGLRCQFQTTRIKYVCYAYENVRCHVLSLLSPRLHEILAMLLHMHIAAVHGNNLYYYHRCKFSM